MNPILRPLMIHAFVTCGETSASGRRRRCPRSLLVSFILPPPNRTSSFSPPVMVNARPCDAPARIPALPHSVEKGASGTSTELLAGKPIRHPRASLSHFNTPNLYFARDSYVEGRSSPAQVERDAKMNNTMLLTVRSNPTLDKFSDSHSRLNGSAKFAKPGRKAISS